MSKEATTPPPTRADWVERCTRRMRELVAGLDVNDDGISQAVDLMRRLQSYRCLEPEAAAEAFLRFDKRGRPV